MKITRTLIPNTNGKPNANGRVYDKEAIQKIIESFKDRKEQGPVYGQIGYPNENDFMDSTIAITGEKVSHEIREVKEDDDDNLIGEIEILNTPQGNIAKALLDHTVFRPRLIGNVNDDGTIRVLDIISFDMVPKEDDAFIHPTNQNKDD